MKITIYQLILIIVASAICVPASADVGLLADNLILLGEANPTLSGIEQVYVIIAPIPPDPNKYGSLWKNLQALAASKVGSTGIKIAHPPENEHILRSLEIPEIRIDIDMLELTKSQQYIFRIQTSLAKKVFLTTDSSRPIKADVWKTKSVMQTASLQNMPSAVKQVTLEQIKAFIHSYILSNPQLAPPDAKTTNTTAQTTQTQQTKPTTKPEVVKYKFVASKNSKVFHSPDCSSAKRIKPENLVGYNSRDEAIQAGKRPCKRCKP